jgi:hypothetical protein
VKVTLEGVGAPAVRALVFGDYDVGHPRLPYVCDAGTRS